MKKILTLMSMLMVVAGSFAQTFTVDGLTYAVLSATDKTAQVTSGVDATDDVTIPETVTYEDIEYSVTQIGSSAFSGNANITSVEAPSVTTIKSSAFFNCSSLESVSLTATTSIGSDAFAYCSKINSLHIGSIEQWCKVNLEGDRANPLQGTYQSVDLYISNSETPATEIVVPNTVTEIPKYAFRNTTITSLSAPTVITIDQYAFSGCDLLKEAIIPKVESLGEGVFGLGMVTISGSKCCTSLESIDLSSITNVNTYAFNGCQILVQCALAA